MRSAQVFMGGELSKRQGCFSTVACSVESVTAHYFFSLICPNSKLCLDAFTGYKHCNVFDVSMSFFFNFEGCFWWWGGALVCSAGARAPSKPLILRPCRSSRFLEVYECSLQVVCHPCGVIGMDAESIFFWIYPTLQTPWKPPKFPHISMPPIRNLPRRVIDATPSSFHITINNNCQQKHR